MNNEPELTKDNAVDIDRITKEVDAAVKQVMIDYIEKFARESSLEEYQVSLIVGQVLVSAGTNLIKFGAMIDSGKCQVMLNAYNIALMMLAKEPGKVKIFTNESIQEYFKS